MSTTPNQDLLRYAQTENVLETSRSALAELEHTDAVELFQKQLALLKKRLLSDPRSLRTTFVSDGVHAIAWEFQQEELGANFTKALWELLLRNDEMSLVLMRFIWSMPLKFKRQFVKGCQRGGGAKGACQCAINQIEKNYDLIEFLDIIGKVNKTGKFPPPPFEKK